MKNAPLRTQGMIVCCSEMVRCRLEARSNTLDECRVQAKSLARQANAETTPVAQQGLTQQLVSC